MGWIRWASSAHTQKCRAIIVNCCDLVNHTKFTKHHLVEISARQCLKSNECCSDFGGAVSGGGVVFQNEISVLRKELSYIALDEKLGTFQCHDIELLQKEGKYLRWRCGVGPLDQGKQF